MHSLPGPLSHTVGSSALCTSVMSHSAVVDTMASILSARGATYTDIVETERQCFVCYDSPDPKAVLLECGHGGMCTGCALYLMQRQPGQAKCPICRSAISRIVRLRPDRPVARTLFACSHQRDAELGMGDGATAVADAVQGPPWPLAARSHAVTV